MKSYLAELIGTFALVLFGCGSAVIAGPQIGFLGISLAFGLAVLVMAYAIGPISGCHVNPAVTIGLALAGRMKRKDVAPYIIAQCIGAILASAVLLVIATGKADYALAANGLGQNGYADKSPLGYGLAACFTAEVTLTALFLIVIFGATDSKAAKGFGGLAIGVTLAIIHMVGIPITGTSVNPARSLAPAIFVGGEALTQLWLFIVAPIVGAVVAAVIWRFALETKTS
ncbi:MAG: aquaporin Z [candidate division Zixibacteria bacterium]|nr:aquaporin Z [candidate division Zixibacteria bacterium]